MYFSVFIFNHTATTEIYTLSLHDALPIYSAVSISASPSWQCVTITIPIIKLLKYPLPVIFSYWVVSENNLDRKSTRLNSSHVKISYAVFCLKKKKKKKLNTFSLASSFIL